MLPDRAESESAARDEEILALLGKCPEGIATSIVQTELLLSERVAQKSLKSMGDRGLLQRERRGRQYRYFCHSG